MLCFSVWSDGMDNFHFRISSEAVEYLKNNVLLRVGSEAVVLTIAPTSNAERLDLDPDKLKLSEEEIAALARAYLHSHSSSGELQWTLGATRKSRLPKKDMFVIDGIECFLPKEVRSAINGRVLRFENGDLVFDPKLDRPSELYRSSSDS